MARVPLIPVLTDGVFETTLKLRNPSDCRLTRNPWVIVGIGHCFNYQNFCTLLTRCLTPYIPLSIQNKNRLKATLEQFISFREFNA